MGDQGTGGSYDSTLAPGHARAQPEGETTQVDSTTQVQSSPTSQSSVVGSKFTAVPASQQDPRSSAGSANGSTTPTPVGPTTPPNSYEPSQHAAESPLQGSSLSPEQALAESQAQNGAAIAAQRAQSHRQSVSPKQQLKQRRARSQQHIHVAREQVAQRNSPSPSAQQGTWHISQQQHQQQHMQLLQHQHQQHEHAHLVEPPVTRATLGELDVGKIIHNPKLRHDINHDPDLHFRPNLDGEKGRKKQEKAQQFWNKLHDELIEFVTNRDEFLKTHADGASWTLPVLLTAVKDIIQTLVPARDRDLLNEGLNVPLLMQQFNRGVVDLEKLASWLSSVLKLHCAPMRDDWVDEMYKELSHGNQSNDIKELVRGLSSLLSVLEAMKLDVANHQIRCLRPLLIEDTVNFEQRFFRKRIESGRMSISSAESWYAQAKAEFQNPGIRHQQAFGETAVFFSGLCKLLMPSVEVKKVPHAFLFDEERILKLRSDMLDAIYLETCMRVYDEAESFLSSPSASPSPTTSSSRTRPTSLLAVPSYLTRPSSQAGHRESWAVSSDFDFNTLPSSAASASPTSSRPCSIDFSTCGSPTLSPRNSTSAVPASASFSRPPTDFAEARARAKELYARLVALLQTAPLGAPPAQRWGDLGPKMAVEIFRTISTMPGSHVQTTSLEQIEQRLVAAMIIGSPLQKEVEQTFRGRLFSALARRIKDFKSMSSVNLFVVAAGGRIHPTQPRSGDPMSPPAALPTLHSARDADPREDGGVEDMATRLAHLGILHWRVWSSMVYERQPAEAEDEDEVMSD